jgi:hypothetical protein
MRSGSSHLTVSGVRNGIHVRGQRDMPMIPGVCKDLDLGLVFQSGMGRLMRKTKQEKIFALFVTQSLEYFTFFLQNLQRSEEWLLFMKKSV